MELLAGAELFDVIVEPAASSHPLPQPEDFWDVVLGSGYRATVDALSPTDRSAVRARVALSLRAHAVACVRTDVVLGSGRRPTQYAMTFRQPEPRRRHGFDAVLRLPDHFDPGFGLQDDPEPARSSC